LTVQLSVVRRDELRREVAGLLERIAILVRGRALLRRAGLDPDELEAVDAEIRRLHDLLAVASRESAAAESAPPGPGEDGFEADLSHTTERS
jgi:hypothetical protein